MENIDTQIETKNDFQTFENPKIYSKKAIWGFSVFFSSIFGGILLWQNLKDIEKKKEANLVLFSSILLTIITMIIVNIPEKPISSMVYLLNMIGGAVLSEYFYPKYFPKDDDYEKKKIWKALVVSIIITIPLVLSLIYAQ